MIIFKFVIWVWLLSQCVWWGLGWRGYRQYRCRAIAQQEIWGFSRLGLVYRLYVILRTQSNLNTTYQLLQFPHTGWCITVLYMRVGCLRWALYNWDTVLDIKLSYYIIFSLSFPRQFNVLKWKRKNSLEKILGTQKKKTQCTPQLIATYYDLSPASTHAEATPSTA